MAQVYWEDVDVGQEIPSLVKHPTAIQMIMWGGAVDDYNPMHADQDVATRAGYPGPIVFGPLIFAFLEQMICDWMGVEGWLRKITVRHNAPAYPNADIVCRGRVTKTYVEGDERYVDLQIQADYADFEQGTVGTATVVLPPKAQSRPLPEAEPMPVRTWIRSASPQ
jgi:acyl dehydratase